MPSVLACTPKDCHLLRLARASLRSMNAATKERGCTGRYLIVVLPSGRCHWSLYGEFISIGLIPELDLGMCKKGLS